MQELVHSSGSKSRNGSVRFIESSCVVVEGSADLSTRASLGRLRLSCLVPLWLFELTREDTCALSCALLRTLLFRDISRPSCYYRVHLGLFLSGALFFGCLSGGSSGSRCGNAMLLLPHPEGRRACLSISARSRHAGNHGASLLSTGSLLQALLVCC